jgi:hypothetical protein
MNIRQTILSIFAGLALSSAAIAGPSSQHSSAALAHSVQGSAHAGAAVIKGTAAVAAVPLLVVGSAGQASTAAGEALLEEANRPLEIGHQVLQKTPTPAQMMDKAKEGAKR